MFLALSLISGGCGLRVDPQSAVSVSLGRMDAEGLQRLLERLEGRATLVVGWSVDAPRSRELLAATLVRFARAEAGPDELVTVSLDAIGTRERAALDHLAGLGASETHNVILRAALTREQRLALGFPETGVAFLQLRGPAGEIVATLQPGSLERAEVVLDRLAPRLAGLRAAR